MSLYQTFERAGIASSTNADDAQVCREATSGRTALAALAQGMGRDYPVQAIAAADLRAFRDDGLAVLSPATVRSYLLVLQRFFAYLQREGWIRRDPFVAGAAGLRLPRARGRKDHLRPEEVAPVLDVLWQLAPDVAPIATALVLGGWRKGEIVNHQHGPCRCVSR